MRADIKDPKLVRLERKVLRAAEVWVNTAQNGHDTTYQAAILKDAVFSLQDAKGEFNRKAREK